MLVQRHILRDQCWECASGHQNLPQSTGHWPVPGGCKSPLCGPECLCAGQRDGLESTTSVAQTCDIHTCGHSSWAVVSCLLVLLNTALITACSVEGTWNQDPSDQQCPFTGEASWSCSSCVVTMTGHHSQREGSGQARGPDMRVDELGGLQPELGKCWSTHPSVA